MNSQLSDLHCRLLKLETQNRRFKQFGAAALIVACSLVVMGQAPSKKTVEANEFILKDANGHVRAKLGMSGTFSNAPGLELMDEKGATRMKLTAESGPFNFSSIYLFDENGNERGIFTAEASGAALLFRNAEGTRGEFMRAEGITVLGPVRVVDEQGFEAVFGSEELVTKRTGETHKTSAASIVLFDKDKNVIWKAP